MTADDRLEEASRLAAQLRSNADAHQEREGTERRRAGHEIERLLGLLAEKDATIQRLVDRDLIQPAEWLGEKRTFTGDDVEEPGNDAYMDYLERVLTATGYSDIRWGQVVLAIALDRMVRENEKARALDGQEGS